MFRPDGGENWLDVNKRVHSFLEDLVVRHMRFGIEEKKDDCQKAAIPKILCVTHGGLITEMLNVLQEMEGKEPALKDKVRNCAIYVFKVQDSEDGRIRIESIIENDDSHLVAS